MWRTRYWLIVTVGYFFACSASSADQLVIQHSGANDPTTEGWTDSNATMTSSIVAAPVTNDANTGMNAWSLSYPGLAFPRYYSAFLNSQEVTSAATFGWELTADLRIPTISPGVNFTVDVNLPNVSPPFLPAATSGYTLNFNSDSPGGITVSFHGYAGGNSTSFDLQNPTDYHFYQIIYNPVAKNADLVVDGIEQVENLTGGTSGGAEIDWGTSFVGDGTLPSITGQANFNLVQFDIVPEPSTLTLLGLGSLGFLLRRRFASDD
jgi:hypothetical protein